MGTQPCLVFYMLSGAAFSSHKDRMASKLKIFTVLFRNSLPAPILENPPPTLSPSANVLGCPGFRSVLSEFCSDASPSQESDGTFSASCLLTSVRTPGKVGTPRWAQRELEMLERVLPVDRLQGSAPGRGRGPSQQILLIDLLDLVKVS